MEFHSNINEKLWFQIKMGLRYSHRLIWENSAHCAEDTLKPPGLESFRAEIQLKKIDWNGIFTGQIAFTVNEPANRYIKPVFGQHEFSGCHKFRLAGEENIDIALAVHSGPLEIIFQVLRCPSTGALFPH